jgi:hypothetical protein
VSEADAAAFRNVFYRVTQEWHDKLAGSMSEKQTFLWGQLYAAVRDSQAGLAVLAEITSLKEEVKALKVKLAVEVGP